MRSEIFQKVQQLIAANNHIPLPGITMDSSFEELHMDSLDALSLINDLEQAYDISIPNQDAIKIRTVRDAVENLEKLLVLQ